MAPIKSRIPMRLNLSGSIIPIFSLILSKVNPVPSSEIKRSAIAIMKPKSPTRLRIKALFAAVILEDS